MLSSVTRRKSWLVPTVLVLIIVLVYKYAFTAPSTSIAREFPTNSPHQRTSTPHQPIKSPHQPTSTPHQPDVSQQHPHSAHNNQQTDNVMSSSRDKSEEGIRKEGGDTLVQGVIDSPATQPSVAAAAAADTDYFVKECNHFTDWPSPSNKLGCDKSKYNVTDQSVSIVIYMSDDLDSYPVQTFLSAVQFTQESQISISNVVLAFLNNSESHDGHMTHIDAITKVTTSSLPVVTTSAGSEWRAKQQAVELAKSEQVVIVDDTLIVNRGFIKPLLFLLQERPRALIVPHVDSLLPARIYVSYDDKKLHPDSLIWQETVVGTYHVTADMKMVREVHKDIQTLPSQLPSGGLNGQSLAGRRSLLLSLLSKMKTDEPAELSLLSYMCGDGIVVTKCAVVVRSNNYYITAPTTLNPEQLQRLYPLLDTNPNREMIDGCEHVDKYFDETRKFVEQD